MITQAVLKERLRYDPDTGIFVRVNSVRPCATSRWIGRKAGTITTNGYVMIRIGPETIQAHRLVWLYMTGSFPQKDIDHVNGIRTDNRWINLRNVTRQVNLQNQRKASKNNLCGFLGVSPKRKKFTARIMVDRKVIRLGVFDTPELAYEAYVVAKRRLHVGGTL